MVLPQSSIDHQAYLSARSELIAKELALRYDAAKLASLSAVEAEANRVMERVRSEEADKVWGQDTSSYPGMPFNEGRSRLENTELFSIIKKMPKGALLHCHMDATVDVRFLLGRAVQTPGMHIQSSEPLHTPAALHRASIVFRVLPESAGAEAQKRPNDAQEHPATGSAPHDNTGNGATDLYSPIYAPNTWVPFSIARSTFPYPHVYAPLDGSPVPAYLPGTDSSAVRETAFDSWVHSLLTLTPHAGVPEIRNSKQAWAKFLSTFATAEGLLGYEPTLRAYIKQMCYTCIEDGVPYLETRLNFLPQFMVRADGSYDLSHAEWVRIYGEAVAEVQKELEAQGRRHLFWGSKIIYSTVRIISNEELREAMEDCLSLKQQFPDLIVGFDLVGHEDPGVTLKDYLPSLLHFQQRQQQLGVHVPFVFHAGETLADGDKVDDNLYDAILLGTKRIGHGFSLAKHPLLMQLCKERKICVEVCPISNELLRYTGSMPAHPLPVLLNSGVPVSLSCDDPAIFGNFGLSYEFYQVINSSAATTLASCGVLARQSIEHAQLTPEERKRFLVIWDQSWVQFIQWVVETHGER